MAKHRSQTWFIFILTPILCMGSVQHATSQGKYREEVWKKKFTIVQEECRLYLEDPAGVLQIWGEDRSDVALEVQKLSDKGNPERITVSIENKMEETKIKIEMPGADRPVIQDMPYLANVRMHVPKNCELQVRSKVFVLEVNQLKGHLLLNGINGNVTVNQVHGKVQIHIKNGQVTLQNVVGQTTIENVGGDIKVFNLNGCSHITSINGNIWIDFKDFPSKCRMQTQTINGNIEISLPVKGVHLDLKTILGLIRIAIDVRVIRQVKGWEKRLIANAGKMPFSSRIVARTMNGNITIYPRANQHQP